MSHIRAHGCAIACVLIRAIHEPDWCQFHQHFTREFFVQIFYQSQNVIWKSCQNVRSYEKFARKTLMKLTAGVHSSQSRFLKIVPKCFFLILTGEESSQPTKHESIITISRFWLRRPQFLTYTVESHRSLAIILNKL